MFTELAAKNRNQKRKQKVEEKKKCFSREIAGKEREGDKKKMRYQGRVGKTDHSVSPDRFHSVAPFLCF